MASLEQLANTKWAGRGELWLDAEGNQAELCDCRLELGPEGLEYHWSYEGKPHTGKLVLRAGGADFTDTFHAPTTMSFVARPEAWALLDLLGTYSGGEGPDWGWRILLSLRPSGELVLQMTNIAPWGEEGRAVRMTCERT